MKYSIVIPTYNHCEDLLKPCIESIFKYTNMRDVELIISANGCVDNTKQYLDHLRQKFNEIGFEENLKIVWHDKPLGYSRATNAGISLSTGSKIVLLNNDTILLPQKKNFWLDMLLTPFINNENCGISGPIKTFSEAAAHDFIIFFCAMIDKNVFNKIGLLNEEYGVGGGEDIEFCVEAVKNGFTIEQSGEKHKVSNALYSGIFPIYHLGEGTVHDTSLVSNWTNIFLNNQYRLAKKYNKDWFYANALELDKIKHKLEILNTQDPAMYREIVEANQYHLSFDKVHNKTVIDIGANIGAFSLYSALLGAKQVIAVEPVTASYNTFMNNIQELNLDNIKVYKNIISSESGNTVPISLNPNAGANSAYNVADNFEMIKTLTFYDLMNEIEDSDIVLKLDCEGGEYDVIIQTPQGVMNRISEIMMEVHTDLHPVYKGIEVIEQKLIQLGFKKITSNQIYSWQVDQNGQKINYKELPYFNQYWKRNE